MPRRRHAPIVDDRLAFIGFGEAGMAFARRGAFGFDRRQDADKRADFGGLGVAPCGSLAGAVAGSNMLLSLVTADQALAVAREAAPDLVPGALWFDMNSVSPQTKRAAAAAIAHGGGRYVDVAVMAPVNPARQAVPLLVSGEHAFAGAQCLGDLGFTRVRTIDGPVGSAAAIKMIRSVMIKGVEALSAECALAAQAAGVLDEVIASLDSSADFAGLRGRFDYQLERMMVHGERRAAEMEEVVATLDALGTGSAMSRATAERQRAIGSKAITPPAALAEKLAALMPPVRLAEAIAR